MADAGIPNLPADKAEQRLQEMDDRFFPNLSEDEAKIKFEKIIDSCVNH